MFSAATAFPRVDEENGGGSCTSKYPSLRRAAILLFSSVIVREDHASAVAQLCYRETVLRLNSALPNSMSWIALYERLAGWFLDNCTGF